MRVKKAQKVIFWILAMTLFVALPAVATDDVFGEHRHPFLKNVFWHPSRRGLFKGSD
jgi:hypothetical protein